MLRLNDRWKRWRRGVLDLFVVANLGALTVDIYLAHSVNGFAEWEEWIPFYFSAAAPVVVIVGMWARWRGRERWDRWLGGAAGVGAIAVGIAGLMFHLNSQFFIQQSIRSLVYTAPFAAPLAYTGLGFLLMMNRMVEVEMYEWGQWVVVMAMGGFVGNFVLTLCDHAQNGFYHWTEWIGVYAAAVAAGFLGMATLNRVTRGFLLWCGVVLGLEVAVGILGAYFHLVADIRGEMGTLVENAIFGAPPFAPLLFVNLAVLGWMGVYDLATRLGQVEERREEIMQVPTGGHSRNLSSHG